MPELKMGYTSYNFIDKDPMIDALRGLAEQRGFVNAHGKFAYGKISEASGGVGTGTLYGWFEGVTVRPQQATMAAAMLGMCPEGVIIQMTRHGIWITPAGRGSNVRALRTHETVSAKLTQVVKSNGHGGRKTA